MTGANITDNNTTDPNTGPHRYNVPGTSPQTYTTDEARRTIRRTSDAGIQNLVVEISLSYIKYLHNLPHKKRTKNFGDPPVFRKSKKCGCTLYPVHTSPLPIPMTAQHIHFTADGINLTELDARIRQMGFSSRADYCRACMELTIRGTGYPDNNSGSGPEAHAWILAHAGSLESIAERDAAIDEILRTTLHALIAVKGSDVAAEKAGPLLKERLCEKTGIWYTDTEIRTIVRTYELRHKTELTRHKNSVLAELSGGQP